MLLFLKYAGVGIINTLVHWGIFYIAFSLWDRQSLANGLGFCVAVVVSYVLNSTFTFKQSLTGKKFVLFTLFMGILSVFMGFLADTFSFYPIVTLVSFSLLSLGLGFIFSKYIVFRG